MTITQWRAIQEACHQLGKSARGRATLVALLAWINDGGIGLDQTNQEAVFTLLDAVWTDSAGSACQAMAQVLEDR